MRRFVRNLLLLCIFLSGVVPVSGARNYYFSRITVDNGLSHNTVKCLLQDSYGFMWFGTKNGLNRYDGQTIRLMDCNDLVSGHGNHNISSLFEDHERNMWVGTDKGVFIYNPVTEAFTEFAHSTESGRTITNWISAIDCDNKGNIWIVSPNEGVFRWDGRQLFHYSVTPEEAYALEHPESMCIRRNGQLWIGTTGAGLFRYYPDDDRFEQFITDNNGHSLKGENIFAICEYGNSLAIAIHEGELKKYDFQSGIFSIVDAPTVHNTLLRDVKWFGGNELWVATHEGVFIINEEKHTIAHIREEIFNPHSISDKTCGVIYQDNEKGVWIGTMLGGVNYCANSSLDFDKYIPYDRQEGVLCRKIRGLAEDHDGNIWIGTEDEGVCMLDPDTGETRTIEYQYAKQYKLINTLAFVVDGEELWYGLFKHGMGVINLKSHRFKHFNADQLGIDEPSVYAIYKDSRGNIWLSTASEVYVRYQGTSDFRVVEELRNVWVFNILEDSRGYIWFANMGMGLNRYNPSEKSVRHYANKATDPLSLSSNSVSSIFEDSRGRLWISTDRGGLCRYNHETDNFKSYSIAEGLPDDVVYKILEDSRGMLWFGTNRGLVRFDPETESVIVYTREDGLLGNQFNYNAAIKDRNGKLWFGGLDGIISFSPEKVNVTDYNPPLYITKLTINNVEQAVTDGSPLSKSILFTDKLTLNHKQSNIGLEFTSVQFSHSNAVEYFYRMEGVEQEWVNAGESQKVYYSQLAPGEYVFHVKVVNRTEGSELDSLSLHFVIRPPWWSTRIAKTVYVLLVLGIGAAGIHLFLKRRKFQMLEQQRLFETEKEKELYLSKIQFFNEIAHEIRTPLTLINGPLEDVIELNSDNRLNKNLHIISRNTKRLLDLIHQLLDFRNVDMNRIRMDYTYTDIVLLVAEIVERFEPSMNKRGKSLVFKHEMKDLIAAIDKEAVTKILSNLLSNAMKYACSQVEISIFKFEDSFSVEVSSDGDNIPGHLTEKIFEPFYRMDNASSIPGTGIGLSLSRSLAELHNGSLILDENHDRGNTFILTLSLKQDISLYRDEDADDSEGFLVPDPEIAAVSTSESGYTVLLVEDNQSMQDYIADKLRESCVVITAGNGVEALGVLRNQSVDLVVTDIMMPDMDGMELCRRMKQDENLQYTPVVFLTAKNDLKAKIDGLEGGAEAFVEKPFSFAYLKALIFSIIENRRKEREAFAKLPFIPVSNIRMNTADKEFIDRIISIIHDNMADEKLNVEYLADSMCMNRSSLLRKIKSITNMSAVDFIKVMRLKQAAVMLREGRYRINEICFAVGINSPSYFSKLFQQQFGMLPKEFERQSSKNEKESD